MLAQVFTVTGPIFMMVLVGILLKRFQWIDDAFIATASSLTFRVTLPALLFLSIYRADLDHAFRPALAGFFCLASLLCFAGAWAWSIWRVPFEQRGLFVQGAFRGNCGIVGLALAANQYGDFGLASGGVLSGVAVILFNILSVIVLSIYSGQARPSLLQLLSRVLRNPLILGVLTGLLASYLRLPLPEWLLVSGNYLAAIALPVALICIGGALSFRSLADSGLTALASSLIKVVFYPFLFTWLAWLVGFEGPELGILFLFLASPTAAASYVMARAAGSDGKLAANIIALTTILSLVTITGGVYGLQRLGLAG
ncbi:AEC family transporter [Marinobacter caseinilyticus]|uniref:AEC family transporter n=1 Tax=Marinobacter caseinilyticus TaxID=2692195 RepID=UPI001409E566|nr:AEC family transporter [Marinobacter caseinilyticus]